MCELAAKQTEDHPMIQKSMLQRSKGLQIGLVVGFVLATAFVILAWFQLRKEQQIDREDLERRAHALAHQMQDTTLESLALSDLDLRKAMGNNLDGYRRLIGSAIFRNDGRMVVAGKGLTELADELQSPVGRTIQDGKETVEFVYNRNMHLHILVFPVRDACGLMKGVLAVVHDASHLEDRSNQRLVQFGLWTMILTFLITGLIVAATYIVYDRPLARLASWMQRLRSGNADEALPRGLPVVLLATESDRLATSFRAARAAIQADSLANVGEQNQWNRERLGRHAIELLRGEQLVVVSNREPYMHRTHEGKLQLIVPAGGLVTALDPVLQACGGVWVAHGAGDGDRQTSDPEGRLSVPPGNSRYTLKRVWLSREEEQGYYYGLANEGLWPLCHIAHERPIFRDSDWKYYVEVNQRFADAVLSEIGASDAMILVQDYQLALVPQMLRAARPNLRIAIFWHIPWPNPEAFRICPWRVELLQGMLGANLIGFHLQQYCNNFLDTVDRMVEAKLDWDHFAVEHHGCQSLVRPFPISVESWTERSVVSDDSLKEQLNQIRKKYKLGSSQVIIGVERIDYTKGIPERFRALARFFEKYPEQREKYTFVVLGAPSRTHIRRYRELITELETLADEINWRFQTDSWKPLRFLVAHHDPATVYEFMRLSSICVVSSLHDGMNLVAKEYVAAKTENDGVLILSEFAGAARELSDALIINPYDTEQFADTIRQAVEMDPAERARRMERMRRIVSDNNVYRWAGSLLSELAAVRLSEINLAK